MGKFVAIFEFWMAVFINIIPLMGVRFLGWWVLVYLYFYDSRSDVGRCVWSRRFRDCPLMGYANGEWDGICACGKAAMDSVRCRYGATHGPRKQMPWEAPVTLTKPTKHAFPWNTHHE